MRQPAISGTMRHQSASSARPSAPWRPRTSTPASRGWPPYPAHGRSRAHPTWRHTLEAGIGTAHTASVSGGAQEREAAWQAEEEGGIHPSLWPCGLVCGSIRREGLRIPCARLRRGDESRSEVQVRMLAGAYRRISPQQDYAVQA